MRRASRTINLRALKYSAVHLGFVALLVLSISACDRKGADRYAAKPKGTVTFNKDIAPIVFNHCSGCHHPGESAPFDLLTYGDVRKHAKQIVDVTQRRYMPPWLPDATLVHFIGERRLSSEKLGLIRQWAEEGSVEGDAKDLPPQPKWDNDWKLGQPDVVVKPAVPFSLPAEGRDVYRNLVIPIPLSTRRYVRGIEFRANTRAVHHAFFKFDRTKQGRALDGKDGQPGFAGIHSPKGTETAVTFASWQPGKTPRFYAEDLAWAMETNTDLILQLHLQPIGKVESVAPEVAFYFTDKPGAAVVSKIPLNSYTIEIPVGVSNYVATDSFVLPVDVELRGVLPHAHYLCRQMKGYAQLPNGTQQWLVVINDWDFNWQGDYQFVTPLQLPKGTKVVMEYTYDNSTNNPRNPNNPPQIVRYGSNSTDEMGELWLQVVMKTQQDFSSLQRALQPRVLNDTILTSEMLLRQNPRDVRAHTDIGSALLMMGRWQEALPKLKMATEIDPSYDEAHYFIGLGYRMTKQFDNARREFEKTLELNPKHARARGNLGLVLTEQNDLVEAERQFELALQLNPNDDIAREMLSRIRKSMSGSRQ